jgi:xanthine phosphoribosyltransferase
MMRTLELTFGLDYQRWIKGRVDEGTAGLGTAGVKLRDKVLKEGKVLPNDIIDVSAFMDSQIDVNLMDECARELSDRIMQLKPSKILTVATTGLVIALPMARYLQVPVVYARKERSVVMADTFKAAYSSKTVGKNRELMISKSHIDPDDRILIVDDFLSSGASQEALLRIISDAGATAVGVGVLLEKVYDSGRQSLSGFNVPILSLCRIASVQGGVIQLLEEDGYDSKN